MTLIRANRYSDHSYPRSLGIFLPLVFIVVAAMMILFPHSLDASSVIGTATDLVTGKKIEIRPSEGGKADVFVFVSAKCPCSASYEGELKSLAKEYQSKGFRFWGVHSNADEPLPMSAAHFKSADLGFPVVEDQKYRWADQLGALKTPHVFVLSSKGEVIYQGGLGDRSEAEKSKRFYLREVLAAVSAGKSAPYREMRALGCLITRKEGN